MLNDTTLSKRARQKKVIKYDFNYSGKHKQIGRKYDKMLIVFICGWWDYGWLFFLFILCSIFSMEKALLLQSDYFFFKLEKDGQQWLILGPS